MCGIAGIWNFNQKPVTEAQLNGMQQFLAERGPDNNGQFIQNNIGLAHTRLKIIDLTENAAQPMQSADKKAILVYNGEIYNYSQLKTELQKQGCNFNGNSDTETLLHAYQKWGINTMLAKIEGMFAFSVYDTKKKKLWLCRDRFGQKPLYYFKNNKTFSFSSDIRSLQHLHKNELTINYQSIDYYLTELTSPQPMTIWNEIKQVPKGSYLEIDKNGENNIHQYYNLPEFQGKINSIEEAKNIIEKELNQAILKRTVSDVPIGTFLSGGIDSGLITALLAQHSKEPINTFTVSLPNDENSEHVQAQKVAERYNTNHTTLPVTGSMIKGLENIVNYFGEPFADSSCIPSYFISQEITKHVKVALSGDGGDEVFAGYHEYGWAQQTDSFLIENPNAPVRKLTVAGSKVKSKFISNGKNLGHLQAYANMSSAEKLFRQMGFNQAEKKYLYAEDFQESKFAFQLLENIWQRNKRNSLFKTLQYSSFDTRLLNDYLVKIDRMSMAHSLEIRSPFLDHQLIETALSVSPNLLAKNGQVKFLLRKIASKHLGKEALTAKKKGFGIPLHNWLRKDLKNLMLELLSENQIKKRNLFQAKFIQQIITEHLKGTNTHTHKIWALMCLELWFQKNVDQ